MNEKTCTKCGQTKPLSEYRTMKLGLFGRGSVCKECVNLWSRGYREAHREEDAAKRLLHKDEKKEYDKRRYLADVDKSKAERRETYRKRADYYCQKAKEYRLLADPKELRATKRKWEEEHREQVNQRGAAWKRSHPEKVREATRRRRAIKRAVSDGHYTEKEWGELLVKYGNKCLCCGKDDTKLERDHVIPLVERGPDTIDNIQPLCRTCNAKKWRKTIDYREVFG